MEVYKNGTLSTVDNSAKKSNGRLVTNTESFYYIGCKIPPLTEYPYYVWVKPEKFKETIEQIGECVGEYHPEGYQNLSHFILPVEVQVNHDDKLAIVSVKDGLLKVEKYYGEKIAGVIELSFL